ncbi:MAG TPA: hypothetical protein VIM89_18505 [Mucilaginibacter sp.]
MKKILSLLIFLLPCFAFAQKKSIDGFMDIPFESDSATVKAAVLAKGGIKVDSLSKKDQLTFSNFSFSDRPINNLNVFFMDNKAYDAFFDFSNTDDILNYYDSLVADITAVYGKPGEVYNAPGYTNSEKIRMLLKGNIDIRTLWQSKNRNVISLHIVLYGNALILRLRYQNTDLSNAAAAKRRSDL